MILSPTDHKNKLQAYVTLCTSVHLWQKKINGTNKRRAPLSNRTLTPVCYMVILGTY